MSDRLETSRAATVLLLLTYGMSAGILIAVRRPDGPLFGAVGWTLEFALVVVGALLLVAEIGWRRARAPRAASQWLSWALAAAVAVLALLAAMPDLRRLPFYLVAALVAACPLLWISSRLEVADASVEMRWYERLGAHFDRQPALVRVAAGGILLAALGLSSATVFLWLVLLLGALSLIFPEAEIAPAESERQG